MLPDGPDYKGGIYKYLNGDLELLCDEEKTEYTLEMYPELIDGNPIAMEELIRVGMVWQYLSLKVESMGLGVSQRARAPKKIHIIVNRTTNENHLFLYSVAVRERDNDYIVYDALEPPNISQQVDCYVLEPPDYYKSQLEQTKDQGSSLEDAIFNKQEKRSPDFKSLYQVSNLLWACQGETDHATHGNRDGLEKNGFGRVHASGCAGFSIYPIIIVKELANIPKGAYYYNPIGFSVLNKWIHLEERKTINQFDHFIQMYSSEDIASKIESKFKIRFNGYCILLCMDRKKPCSGFMHRSLMDTSNWSEIEVGMSLAGLHLQANAFGLQWEDALIPNLDNQKNRDLFQLSYAETKINEMAKKLINPAKNERLSVLGTLVPVTIFYLK